MGVSLSWLAFKGTSREAALSAVGLRGTEVFEEIPEAPISGVLLPSGWYMVVSNRGAYPTLMEDTTLARLSAGRNVITCFVEEHVMCSHAAEWRGGRELWSLMHSPDSGGIDHLEVKGEAPPFFAAIRDRLRAEQSAAGGNQAEVDHLFDVPVETARQFTDYRYDRDIPGAGRMPFEVLETIGATPKRSWLRRILRV